jgi:hypothetical protein
MKNRDVSIDLFIPYICERVNANKINIVYVEPRPSS